MEQAVLWERTSRIRAARMPSRTSQKGRILLAHYRFGPMTDEECSSRTGIGLDSLSRRRSELVQTGHLQASGLMRRTRSGAQAIVWELAPGMSRHIEGWAGQR